MDIAPQQRQPRPAAGLGRASDARLRLVKKEWTATKYEITFRTGDTVDGVIQTIDQRGVKFESHQTETTFVQHEQLDSITLGSVRSRVEFDEETMKR